MEVLEATASDFFEDAMEPICNMTKRIREYRSGVESKVRMTQPDGSRVPDLNDETSMHEKDVKTFEKKFVSKERVEKISMR